MSDAGSQLQGSDDSTTFSKTSKLAPVKMQSPNFSETTSKLLLSIKDVFNLINAVITTIYYLVCQWLAIQKRPVFVQGFVKNGFENVEKAF
uniref:Uncharacterized protein n=1 Tax=Panagrolaimus sp. JU765 TaxID=591449 RepID=A0AC34PXT3_9BILA